MTVPLGYDDTQDDLANSTYNITAPFRMLHYRKLKNVDKDILEGISSIEPLERRW